MNDFQTAVARKVESFLMFCEDTHGVQLADVDGQGHCFPLEIEAMRELLEAWAETQKETT